VPYRITIRVDGPASRIAHSARPDHRPEQVTTTTNAPHRHRLAKIFVVLFQAQLAGHIEQAENTDRGIDQQTADIDAGIAQFALQRTIDPDPQITRRCRKIADPAFTGNGAALSYTWATGLAAYLSMTSCTANIARLKPS
jgi:hypothetical protein